MSKTIREENKASKKPSPVERITQWFEGEMTQRPATLRGLLVTGRRSQAVPPRPVPSPHAPFPAPQAEPFSINFLRHETVPRAVRRALVYAALGYLAANFLVTVALIGMTVEARSEWRLIKSEVERGLQAPVEADALTREMLALRDRFGGNLERVNALAVLHQQRFPVGGKLAALSRTLPARTWITGLSGSREGRKLTVSAAYLVDADKPYELPTKSWIEALKADPRFSGGLKRLDLGSTSRKTQGTSELLAFDLIAEWSGQGGESQPAAKPAKKRRSR